MCATSSVQAGVLYSAFSSQPQASGDTLVVQTTNPGIGGTYVGSPYTVSAGGDSYNLVYDGYDGVGVINDPSGALTLPVQSGVLALGFTSTGSGTFNLSGTGSVVALGIYVGYQGVGVFNQTGGTQTLSQGGVAFGFGGSSASGAYNLQGGTLNTYSVSFGSGSGTLNLNGGTLQANSNNPDFIDQGKPSDTINVQSGGATGSARGGAVIDTQTFNVTIAQPLVHDTTANAVATDGGLIKVGGGTLTFTGANTYTGPTTISAGNLSLGSGGSLGATDITVGSGATFQVTNSGSLPATNTGGTTSSSNLTLNGTSASPATALLGGTGTLYRGTVTVGNSNGGVGVLTQSNGTLNVNPAGSVVLASVSGSTGTYNLNAGILNTGQVVGGSGTSTLHFGGGTLQANKGSTLFFYGLSIADVQAAGATIDTQGYNVTATQSLYHNTAIGAPTRDGGLTKLGSGTLKLSGANTYTGPTTVNAGTLQAGEASVSGANGAFGVNSAVTMANVAGATLDLNNFGTQIGSLTGGGTTGGNVTLGSATLTVGADATSPPAYAGVISGTGQLLKFGTGTLTLAGTNTYQGNTTVTGGVLAISNDAGSALGQLANTSGILLYNGGTMLLSGSATITDRLNNAAPVTINGGAKLMTGGLNEGTRPTAVGVGGAVGVGALTLAGASSSSRATIDFGTAGTGSALVFSSLSASSAGTYVSILNYTGVTRADSGAATNDRLLFANDPGFTLANLANWQFYNDANVAFATGGIEIVYNGYFEIVPVPEPATWLGGALLLGATGMTWRRRSRAQFAAQRHQIRIN